MVAVLANVEHQSKILVETTTLTTLEQKFDRLVSLEMVYKLAPYLHSTIHPVILSNVQRSDCKWQSQKVKIFPTPQSIKPCRGCGRTSHLNGSMNQKGCLAAKLACFNCGLIGHKNRSANRLKMCTTKQVSHVFTTKGHMEDPSRMAHQLGQIKRRGKLNSAQPKSMPHLIWNGSKFWGEPPDPPLSLTKEVTMFLEAHAEFGYTSMAPSSFYTHQITTVADTGAQTCSSGPEI